MEMSMKALGKVIDKMAKASMNIMALAYTLVNFKKEKEQEREDIMIS
jgi:hypothetical protein